MRRLCVIFALLLVTAACGGDATDDDASGVATTTAGPPSTTTTSPSAAQTTTTSQGGTPATTTTTSVATSTTHASGGEAAFAITQVVFGEAGHVTITNLGSGTGDLGGFWLCQRPSYFEIPAVEVPAGESVAVAFSSNPEEVIGTVATIAAGRSLGFVQGSSGEIGLYSSGSFSDPEAIVSYVEWGAPDHGRSSVAVAAGIWPDGGFVPVPAEALALSATALPPTSPDDWFPDVGG